ncbi:hypothetical protein ACKAV7_000203 [Fusarium commune]
MMTVEGWQGQLPSRLGGGEGSSTQVSTQGSHDIDCPEGLRHKLSNWRASVPFRSAPDISSKPAQQKDPKIPQYDGSDSGIGLATPSSQTEPTGFDLPGTELKYFDEPISERLKARFFDIKVLYTQPLLDYILKRKKDPGDISMKLKYLGLNLRSIQLYIVIQCERKVAKRVRKFFAQGHVEEELLPDFRVFVLEKALLRLTNDEVIEVIADSNPKRTWCGAPIRLRRGDKSVMATFGGVIVVETSYKRLVGLTAAHSLKKLHGSPILQPSRDDREGPFLSSSSDVSKSDEDSDCDSATTTESSLQHLEHTDDKGLITITSQHVLAIGTILCDTFNTPLAQNYDWAAIDLNQQDALPNRVVLDQHPDSSDFEEESRVEPTLFPSRISTALVLRQVLVLKQGSSFVEVYDLIMEHGSSLSPGDSGSWVVDAKTSELYGHVVSVDAFGEAQVMPIRSTLDSIRMQMNATRVSLPYPDELQLLQEESRSRGVAHRPTWKKGGQSVSSPPSTEAYGESSSRHAVSRQDIVAKSLEIARESPEGASYPSIRQILESALEEIWAKVQDQPDSYVMTRDEFAVFNFFQHRFIGDKMAIAARKRYWGSLSMDSSESCKTESSDLGHIDAILELVQASYRRIGTYGPDFANVATKLYKLEMTLRRLRDEVAEEQEGLPVHIQRSYTSHLHSLVEDWDFAMKRFNSLLDTYHDEEIGLAGEEASMRSELKPIEPVLAGKRMAIELLLDSIQLQKPQVYDRHQSDLEEIKDKVDQIAAHLFANWNAGSFSEGNDDLWRHFQELLEKEGFSSQILSKKKDILMTYINDLGYIADTTTDTLSHARKPLEQSQGTDPHNRKKPDVEHKFDTSIQMDIITTKDIMTLDRKDSVMQQIQPTLSPKETNTLLQNISVQIWPIGTIWPMKKTSPSYGSWFTDRRNNDPPGLVQSSRHMAPDHVEVLQQAGVRYEARPDYVAILGVLSREQVAKLVRESEATITSRPPRAGSEKKQEKPGSKQESFNGRQQRRSYRSSRYDLHGERNDWGGLQHGVRAYDKGGPGGVVGIGSAAVSLLCVLSEAASAI